jgi:hypothetical protein
MLSPLVYTYLQEKKKEGRPLMGATWQEIRVRSGRDDNSVGPLTAIRLTAFGAISLQQNCHPDRSEA